MVVTLDVVEDGTNKLAHTPNNKYVLFAFWVIDKPLLVEYVEPPISLSKFEFITLPNVILVSV